MYKRLSLILILAILFIFVTSVVVFADQIGNYCYCNRDQYGCWVTEEDGRRSYIMFWSEEIKNNFIGKDKPAVVCDPPDGNGRVMELHPIPIQTMPDPQPQPEPQPEPVPQPEPQPEPGAQPEPQPEG